METSTIILIILIIFIIYQYLIASALMEDQAKRQIIESLSNENEDNNFKPEVPLIDQQGSHPFSLLNRAFDAIKALFINDP